MKDAPAGLRRKTRGGEASDSEGESAVESATMKLEGARIAIKEESAGECSNTSISAFNRPVFRKQNVLRLSTKKDPGAAPLTSRPARRRISTGS
jgi:hypothetical protein